MKWRAYNFTTNKNLWRSFCLRIWRCCKRFQYIDKIFKEILKSYNVLIKVITNFPDKILHCFIFKVASRNRIASYSATNLEKISVGTAKPSLRSALKMFHRLLKTDLCDCNVDVIITLLFIYIINLVSAEIRFFLPDTALMQHFKTSPFFLQYSKQSTSEHAVNTKRTDCIFSNA